MLTALVILAGCGSQESTTPAAKPKTATLRKAPPVNLIPPYMVTAVSASHSAPSVVQVKFELRARPAVDTPLDIDLVIVPLAPNVDRVSGTVASVEGLELSDGAQIPTADRPAESIPIAHSVRVLPKREGIFTVTATLTVDAAGASSTQTFAIPVIVAAAPPQAPAKPAASTAAGSAQPASAPH